MFELEQPNGGTDTPLVVVRLSRSWYRTDRGVAHRIEIRYVKRLCRGFNGLEEDVSMCGAETAMENITNLSECSDGLYRVVFNPYRDWESGIVDDWDYSLVPYVKEDNKRVK